MSNIINPYKRVTSNVCRACKWELEQLGHAFRPVSHTCVHRPQLPCLGCEEVTATLKALNTEVYQQITVDSWLS